MYKMGGMGKMSAMKSGKICPKHRSTVHQAQYEIILFSEHFFIRWSVNGE